jgi:DNA uptake protein ComE-like DNA-binding protein
MRFSSCAEFSRSFQQLLTNVFQTATFYACLHVSQTLTERKTMKSFFGLVLVVVMSISSVLAQDAMTARVNINTATKEEMLTIPGVGPKLIDEFMEYHPFTSKEHFETELGKYLGADELTALEQHITLGLVDINTATPEELMTVSGIGEKIADEIQEYRPFTSWAMFEEELGKYLEPQDVANLEFLVTFSQP